MKINISHKIEESAPINDFNGHYQFLNNDHPAWVSLDSVLYPSVSIAYQAARTDNPEIRQTLNEVQTYQKFKKIAMGIPNPHDWNGRRYRVMQKLVRDKFKRNKELGSKLAATLPRNLINTFKQGGQNQLFWGVIQGKGSNNLGKILMSIREQIQNGKDWQNWIFDQGVQNDEKMCPIVSLIVTREQKPIDKLFLEKKNKFFLGNQQDNDFKLDHPSISKTHSCIYFSLDLNLMIVDLGSSNGTTITRENQTFKLEPLRPISLQKNDIIVFGLSTRKYKVEIDSTKVEEYMKEQQSKVEQQIKSIREKQRSKNRSRSRSRSPNHKKTRN